MTAIDPAAKLGDLLLEQPAAARIFEQLDLDYCCGGKRTLSTACAQRGLDPGTVIVMLEALRDEPAGPPVEEHDLRRASIDELCDHIVAVHHDRLREDLPRISSLLDTVVRVHGKSQPRLFDLRRLFAGMRSELEDHVRLEESALFPACRALEVGEPAAGLDAGLLVLAEVEHEQVGDALAGLRELTDGYRTEHALCGSHRKLLNALRELELDLHQHVHEENNLLFPRVRVRAAAGEATAALW